MSKSFISYTDFKSSVTEALKGASVEAMVEKKQKSHRRLILIVYNVTVRFVFALVYN